MSFVSSLFTVIKCATNQTAFSCSTVVHHMPSRSVLSLTE